MTRATDEFFRSTPLGSLIAGWGIIFVPLGILALLGAIFLRPTPFPSESIFGCYQTTGAPPFLIEKRGIVVVGHRETAAPFTIESVKPGYAIQSDEMPTLEPAADGNYAFSWQHKNTFWLRLIGNRPSDPERMQAPNDWSGRILVHSRDFQDFTYQISPDTKPCD